MLCRCGRRASFARSASVTQVLLRSTPIVSPAASREQRAPRAATSAAGPSSAGAMGDVAATASPANHQHIILRTMATPSRVWFIRLGVPSSRSASPAFGIARSRIEDDLATGYRLAELPMAFFRDEGVVEVQLAQLP